MFTHKRWMAGVLAAMMILPLAACGKTGTSSSSGSSASGSAEATLTDWETSSNIYATDETDEALYQKAIEEGGEVTLYSISSRCSKIADAFMLYYSLVGDVDDLIFQDGWQISDR